MKTKLLFISFMVASILAGIGFEYKNIPALIAGVIFLVIIISLVFNLCKTETE